MFYLLVLAALLWEAVTRPRLFSSGNDPLPVHGKPAGAGKGISWLVAGLVALYAAQVALIAWSAYTEPHSQDLRNLPLLVLDDRDDNVFSAKRMIESLGLLLIVCLECTLLYFIWRRLRAATRSHGLAPVVAGAIAILGISLCAPVLLSADPYLYVGYALLGPLAYAPPAGPFEGEFHTINRWWGTPLLPAPYGPVFIAYVHALLRAVPTLALKLEVLRLANCGWFLLALWFLRRAGIAAESLSLIALNPALAYLFVANGHNDIIGITLILGALALLTRYPFAGVALLVTASLIKAPFAIIGIPILSKLPLRRRLPFAAGCLVVAGAASYVAGGAPYIRALRIDASAHLITAPELHALLVIVAVIALAMGLLRNRWALTPAFAMAAFAARMFSWYSAWGLPYAAAAGRLAGFAIFLPLVAYLMESCFDTRVAKLGIALVLLSLALTTLARRRSNASRSALGAGNRPKQRMRETSVKTPSTV